MILQRGSVMILPGRPGSERGRRQEINILRQLTPMNDAVRPNAELAKQSVPRAQLIP